MKLENPLKQFNIIKISKQTNKQKPHKYGIIYSIKEKQSQQVLQFVGCWRPFCTGRESLAM